MRHSALIEHCVLDFVIGIKLVVFRQKNSPCSCLVSAYIDYYTGRCLNSSLLIIKQSHWNSECVKYVCLNGNVAPFDIIVLSPRNSTLHILWGLLFLSCLCWKLAEVGVLWSSLCNKSLLFRTRWLERSCNVAPPRWCTVALTRLIMLSWHSGVVMWLKLRTEKAEWHI